MPAAERARARMVDALLANGRLRTPVVEDAFRSVPRHLFLPDLPISEAYADEAVAVQFADGVATSSASQPSMMSIMLEQLGLRAGQRVLEIGAGTGYNAALMARIVGPTGAVTAVDIDAGLIDSAGDHLEAAGASGIELVCADGAFGHAPGEPYDRIILTVGSSDVRPEWVDQLAAGGRLLLPLAVRGSQLSIAFDLGHDGLLRSDSVRGCAFIRLRGIGADRDTAAWLPGDLSLQLPEDGPGVDTDAMAAVLDEPGALMPTGASVGPVDVWDGFGLWLTLTAPGAGRLLATGVDPDFPDELLGIGPNGATVVLVTPPGARPAGLAAVVPAPGRGEPDRRGPISIRPFGLAGPRLAAELLDSLDAWIAAGAPGAPDWRIIAVPAGAAEPVDTALFVVRKAHCTLLMEVPRASQPEVTVDLAAL